jgi:hypothetical protein
LRRIQFVLTALALMAMMMVALSAPAMADNNGDNNRHDNDRNDNNNNCCNNFLDRHDDFGVFNDFSNDDEEDFFTDVSPFFLGADDVDVDFDNVGNNNDLEGECVVTDVDINGDGFINDADITCFV